MTNKLKYVRKVREDFEDAKKTIVFRKESLETKEKELLHGNELLKEIETIEKSINLNLIKDFKIKRALVPEEHESVEEFKAYLEGLKDSIHNLKNSLEYSPSKVIEELPKAVVLDILGISPSKHFKIIYKKELFGAYYTPVLEGKTRVGRTILRYSQYDLEQVEFIDYGSFNRISAKTQEEFEVKLDNNSRNLIREEIEFAKIDLEIHPHVSLEEYLEAERELQELFDIKFVISIPELKENLSKGKKKVSHYIVDDYDKYVKYLCDNFDNILSALEDIEG